MVLNLWIEVICNVSPNFHSPHAILLPLSVWDQWQIKNRIKVKGKERLKRLWYKWNSNGARPSEAVETLMKLLCWMEMRACSHYSSAYWTKTISAVGVIMLMGVPWPSLAFRLGCEATVFFFCFSAQDSKQKLISCPGTCSRTQTSMCWSHGDPSQV